MVEEQAGIDVIRQVDDELQPAFVNGDPRLAVVDPLILPCPALAVAMLHEHAFARYFKHLGGRAGHEIEPIGVLGRRAIVWPGEFGDVERIFVAIDDERHVGHVALVEPIARDAALRGPAAKVPGAVSQAVGELLGLPRGGCLQAAERGGVGGFARAAEIDLDSSVCEGTSAASRSIGSSSFESAIASTSRRIAGSPSRGGRGPWNW